MLKDTICAISTSLQEGAISIIRLSGDEAIEIVNRMFNKDLTKVKSHTISYGYIIDNNELVDEVLVSVFKGPKSFTKDDVVEINCHGGVFITKKILSLCLANGARLAKRGEFSSRAFINGRIDLTQAEAINDMIIADNESSAKLAIQGMKGSIQKLIDPFVKEILDIIANIEVNIDYPEYEDIEDLTTNKLLPIANDWINKMNSLLERAYSGQIIREGIYTAIIGKPNVGKSSLLNSLLEEDKAIVSHIAGTTRDLVEGNINIGNIKLHLIDTAGIRESQDYVEKIGIERSKKAIEKAQLVILVLDATKEIDKEEQMLLELCKDKTIIKVYNKMDLIEDKDMDKSIDSIYISAINNNIDSLIDMIHNIFDKHLIVLKEPALNNERHIGLLKKALVSMINAKNAMEASVQPDLVEIDIQEAYNSLKEISGEVNRDDLLDTLFSNFCLGK
ncbi:MAG: tRNA uridine-5-carboxymethylaminomethyl(34) synthesis GTPase MnmE [Erysipelotrichaceae bacterium]